MIVYKYLKKKHLLEFRYNGSILINTLYNIRNIEHVSIRDELEGHHRVRISSKEQPMRFSGKEFLKLIPVLKVDKQKAEKATITIDNGAQFNMQIANAFIFCTSLKLEDALFKRFGYEAYYKITRPLDFADILYEKLNQLAIIRCYKVGTVKYADKPIIITNRNKKRFLNDAENQYWNVCFTKPTKFHEEQEYRMVFVPEFAREIKPVIITCPELRKYCAL
jgi:hypothetical protein